MYICLKHKRSIIIIVIVIIIIIIIIIIFIIIENMSATLCSRLKKRWFQAKLGVSRQKENSVR